MIPRPSGSVPVLLLKEMRPLQWAKNVLLFVLLGRPTGFTLPIREVRILAGAGFLTAVCGGMQLMPGLPSRPAGEHVDLDADTGGIVGLS